MPPKAFAVLRALQQSAGRLVTKNELLDAAWPDTFVGDAVLKVTIRQLREVLGDDARSPTFIATVHGRGYRLIGCIDETSPVGPSATAQPVAAPETAPLSDAIVGRDAALQQLQSCWQAAYGGQRRLVFVTGDPGIGKTAVVDRFLSTLARTDGGSSGAPLVGRGHCVEGYGGTEAFLPVLDALDEALRPVQAVDLRHTLRRCAPMWLAEFPWLLTPEDRGALDQELHGASRERMLRQLATTLELGSTTMPLVLVLEDLHWADPSTVQLLTFLAQRRQPARLLIIATFRPVDVIVAAHPLREAVQRLRNGALCTEVPLWFLAETDVETFISRRLGGQVAPELAALVYRRSNGNPLYMRNLVDHLLERGALTETETGWRQADSERGADDVPTAIKQIIEQGLSRFDADAIAILEAASVAGGHFVCAGVATCLEVEVGQVESACERLARRGDVLRPAGAQPLADGTVSSRYEIVHALIQSVLYQRIAAARRMAMHHAWGVWGESQRSGAGELAHHFSMAGTATAAAKAVAYACQAAARATAVFAYEEAVQHFDAALGSARAQLGDDDRLAGELLAELAAAQQRAGQVVAAEATFREAAEHARTTGDAALLARAAIGIGHGYQRLGRQDPEVIDLLESALRGLGPGDHPLRAVALAHLDYGLASLAGSGPRRDGLAREALAMARRLDDIDVWVPVLVHTRWAFRGPQSADEWRAELDTLNALLGRVQDGEMLLMLRSLRVGSHLELGDIASAESALAEFVDCAEEAQIPYFLWLATGLECKIELLRGRLAATERSIERTRAAGERTDHPNVGVLHAGQTALLRIVEGRLDELAPLVRTGVEMFPQVVTWRAVLAYLSAELDDVDDARAQLAILAPVDFAGLPRDTSWFVLTAFASIACSRAEDRQRASSLYELLSPFEDGFTGVGASLLSVGHMGRYLGWLAATLGNVRAATVHFERAIERNGQLGALPWLALSQYDYARMLVTYTRRGDPPRSQELLGQAMALAEQIGMDGWLRHMRAWRQTR